MQFISLSRLNKITYTEHSHLLDLPIYTALKKINHCNLKTDGRYVNHRYYSM